MEGALKLWAIIVLVGALNYASRLSFIAIFARRSIRRFSRGRCGSSRRRC